MEFWYAVTVAVWNASYHRDDLEVWSFVATTEEIARMKAAEQSADRNLPPGGFRIVSVGVLERKRF